MRTLLMLCITVAACAAQGRLSTVPPSELAEQRADIERSWSRWQAGDKGLERGLLTRNPNDSLLAISLGQRLAEEYFNHRAAYLNTQLGDIRQELRYLKGSPSSPGLGLRPEDETKRLKQVLQEQIRLAEAPEPAGLPGAVKQLDREARTEQTNTLKRLAETVESQQQLLKLTADNEREQAHVRDSIITSYQKVASLLDQQVRFNEEKRTLWSEYYDSLRSTVEAETPAPEINSAPTPEPKAKNPATKPAKKKD